MKNLKSLRQFYFLFLAIQIIGLLACFPFYMKATPIMATSEICEILKAITILITLAVVVGSGYLFAKELKKLNDSDDLQLIYDTWNRLFFQRMIAYQIIAMFNLCFYILTLQNTFFILFAMMMVLHLIYFPSRNRISQDIECSEEELNELLK